MMRYGFVMPFGAAADVAEHAVMAESAGWDAIFDWEAVWGDDAWIALTAAAMVTDRIHLGTMLTPIPRVRPWDLASRVSSLDRLSGGRVIVGAGLGALHEGWTAFEADEGRRVRVEKMDEGLAIYAGLMAGQPFSFEGKHYTVKPTEFMLPAPTVQQPHPPVWVVGAAEGRRNASAVARAGGTMAGLAPTGRRRRLARQTPFAGGALGPDPPGAADA